VAICQINPLEKVPADRPKKGINEIPDIFVRMDSITKKVTLRMISTLFTKLNEGMWIL
jgi:hypothetical protein